MGTVMIRCPQTGREIATGFEADAARFRAWVCEPTPVVQSHGQVIALS